MLHRHQTFEEVVANVRENSGLKKTPFFVFSFKESYSESVRRKLEKSISNIKIEFIKNQLPKFVKEKDLFYNKTHLDYVRLKFPKSRKNYLHMCDNQCDVPSFPHLSKYDIVVRFDDDSWFKEKVDIDYSLFDSNKGKMLASAHFTIDDIPKRRETKIGFFEATEEFCKKKNIKPKFNLLARAIENKDMELYNTIPWHCGNFDIYNMSAFRSQEWKEWIDFIKGTGGIFTNRWSDIDIIDTFLYIYFEDPMINLDLFPKKYGQRKDNQGIIHFKRNIFIRILSKLKKKLKSN